MLERRGFARARSLAELLPNRTHYSLDRLTV